MKSTVEQIRLRFDRDVERFSNLETGQWYHEFALKPALFPVPGSWRFAGEEIPLDH